MDRVRLAAVIAFLAAPAGAQDFDASRLAACVDGGGGSSCIGMAAAPCLQTDAGQSTVGQGFCLSSEWEWWDARLNAVYAEARAEAARIDASNDGGTLDLPSSEEALVTMQRAWIVFRDAACDYERSRWSGGTGGGPASAQCRLELTAEQTLFLMDRMW